MFFSGYCFAGGPYSLDTTPLPDGSFDYLEIKNGAFDELHVTRNAENPFRPGKIDGLWYFGTVLHAHFRDTLFAGNVDFTAEDTDSLFLKRRMEGSFDWVYVFQKQTSSVDDFTFEYFDPTARADTVYEYALVAVSADVEGSYFINRVKTCFPGLFIMERWDYFSTGLEVEINDQQQNKPVGVVAPLGRRYPFTVSNADSDYRSGSLSAIFAERSAGEPGGFELRKSWRLRESLNEFLYNGLPKLIKYEDGRMYLASVSGGQISESGAGGHKSLVQTAFGWAEKGDCDDGGDLYRFGFIDVKR